MKVFFYLKKNEKKKNGYCPIMARLSIGKASATTFSIKETVPEKLWSVGRAIGKTRLAVSINLRLDTLRGDAIKHYSNLTARQKKVTAEDVKYHLLGMIYSQETLLAYFHKHNTNFDKRVDVNRAKNTAESYWNCLNHLTAFIEKVYCISDIPFASLNRRFIDKFDNYLLTDRKLAPGTIVLLITRLRTVIGSAIDEGIITADPVAGYEPKRPIAKQKYLPGKELEKLMNAQFDNPRLCLVRDIFLFSCYTGISYCDLRRLTTSDISVAQDGTVWIRTQRKKTGVEYNIPLMDLPRQILKRYENHCHGGMLLPVPNLCTINDKLKEIARICGIKRHVTFHMARHTFASEITLSQGVPIETVSRMLGHTSVKTTQIYAKITNEKIEEDMKSLEQRIEERFKFAI